MTDHILDPDVLALLTRLGWSAEPCGSRVTCSPPPLDTDRDWLVARVGATEGDVSRLIGEGLCGEMGFSLGGGEHYQQQARTDFASLRRGDLNLIVMCDPDLIARHRLATQVCRELNLMDKGQRIVVFRALLYGQSPDSPEVISALERART